MHCLAGLLSSWNMGGMYGFLAVIFVVDGVSRSFASKVDMSGCVYVVELIIVTILKTIIHVFLCTYWQAPAGENRYVELPKLMTLVCLTNFLHRSIGCLSLVFLLSFCFVLSQQLPCIQSRIRKKYFKDSPFPSLFEEPRWDTKG